VIERQDESQKVPRPCSREFVERRHQIAALLQLSFSGPPWYERLSEKEALARIESHVMKSGFEAILVVEDEQPIAALWYDTPSLDELREERGAELVDFVLQLGADVKFDKVVWARESVVHPDHQGKGLATQLRRDFLSHLSREAKEGSSLVLTRMRDDNHAILAVAKKVWL